VHLVNTEPLTAVQHASDIRFTPTHTAEFPLHTVQGVPAETGHYKAKIPVRLVCLVQLWNVFVLMCGPQKSALRFGFVYNCVENALYTAVFASVLPNTEQTLSFVIAFVKLVSSNGSCAKLLQNRSFGRKFMTVYLSTVASDIIGPY